MTTKIKRFLTKKLFDKWMEENQDFFEDYQELCHQVYMINAMWGIEIGIILKNPEVKKGRNLGVGAVDKLFNLKNKTNNDNLRT